jgi:membrane protein DedA with SNARE-associated domain
VRVVPLVLAAAVLAIATACWRPFRWTVRIAAVAIAGALVAYGLGLFDLPNVERTLEDAGGTLGAWTYVVVGGLAFLETGAFVGLVAPGETAVIAGGVIAGQGVIEVVPLLLLVWACCVGGDSLSYWIGRRLGRGFLLRHGHRLRVTEDRLERVEGFFERGGGLTIVIGRFIGVVRALAPFVAGASRMPFARFLPYDIVGSGLWASAFVLLGYVSWRNIDRAGEIASRGTFAIGALAAAGVVAYVAARTLRTADQRQRALRWVRGRVRHNGARG